MRKVVVFVNQSYCFFAVLVAVAVVVAKVPVVATWISSFKTRAKIRDKKQLFIDAFFGGAFQFGFLRQSKPCNC